MKQIMTMTELVIRVMRIWMEMVLPMIMILIVMVTTLQIPGKLIILVISFLPMPPLMPILMETLI